LVNASTGLRCDGGYKGLVYIGETLNNPKFIKDGERPIQLANLLPPGFKLSTEEKVPGTYINIQQPGNNPYQNPQLLLRPAPSQPSMLTQKSLTSRQGQRITRHYKQR